MNREYSLKKNKEFNYVYRRGKSVANRNLVLVYVKKKNDGLKVGFSVSKKVGKAVIRNKTKRLLKESFRQVLDELEQDTLMIFIARPNITSLDYIEVKNNVNHILRKAGLFKEGR